VLANRKKREAQVPPRQILKIGSPLFKASRCCSLQPRRSDQSGRSVCAFGHFIIEDWFQSAITVVQIRPSPFFFFPFFCPFGSIAIAWGLQIDAKGLSVLWCQGNKVKLCYVDFGVPIPAPQLLRVVEEVAQLFDELKAKLSKRIESAQSNCTYLLSCIEQELSVQILRIDQGIGAQWVAARLDRFHN